MMIDDCDDDDDDDAWIMNPAVDSQPRFRIDSEPVGGPEVSLFQLLLL